MRKLFLRSLAVALATLACYALIKPYWETYRWNRIRGRILDNLQIVMGPLPYTASVVPKIKTISVKEYPLYTMEKIQYLTGDNDSVPAYLLIPKKEGRKPAMICLHQTDDVGKDEPVGLSGKEEFHYAKELAELGYVCLVPDYPYLGENTFDPYQHHYISCTMKGIFNHMCGVDLLQSRPDVDEHSIGVIGHSLGGHNALFLAAFDSRLKAVVTSCGFTSFEYYNNGDLTGWSGVRYMPAIATDFNSDASCMPFDFEDILTTLAPRGLFINAPKGDDNFDIRGVTKCVNKAAGVYKDVFNAPGQLVAEYPEAGHEFPEPVRHRAYQFLDGILKHQ